MRIRTGLVLSLMVFAACGAPPPAAQKNAPACSAKQPLYDRNVSFEQGAFAVLNEARDSAGVAVEAVDASALTLLFDASVPSKPGVTQRRVTIPTLGLDLAQRFASGQKLLLRTTGNADDYVLVIEDEGKPVMLVIHTGHGLNGLPALDPLAELGLSGSFDALCANVMVADWCENRESTATSYALTVASNATAETVTLQGGETATVEVWQLGFAGAADVSGFIGTDSTGGYCDMHPRAAADLVALRLTK